MNDMYDTTPEQQFLGSLMLADDIDDKLIELKPKLSASEFIDKDNAELYKRLYELHDQGTQINPITITSDKVSVEFVATISQLGITASLIDSLAEKVHKNASKREFYNALETAAKHIQNGHDFEKTKTDMFQYLSNSRYEESDNLMSAKEVFDETLERIAVDRQNGNTITGITTGYKSIDNVTNGLKRGQLMIIGARPSVGKTALALNMVERVARKTGLPVIVFSMEMNNDMLAKRMLTSKSYVDSYKVQKADLSDGEFSSLADSANKLRELPIFFDDRSSLRTSDITEQVMRVKRKYGEIGMIFVDYLGLIESDNSRGGNRVNEVSDISRELKKLSMPDRANAPVVALAQLSRAVEQRQDKRPIMSDLRDSGSIEQDADVVGFLYRDDYYSNDANDEGDSDVTPIELIIGKNRNGKRDTVTLMFDKAHNAMSGTSTRDKDKNTIW